MRCLNGIECVSVYVTDKNFEVEWPGQRKRYSIEFCAAPRAIYQRTFGPFRKCKEMLNFLLSKKICKYKCLIAHSS